jgi:1-acyl-sn-glycerol-3-phosphate acyltransferase
VAFICPDRLGPRAVRRDPALDRLRTRAAATLYFANHTSHIDTVALWSALPPDLRTRTRTAAAADYWGANVLKRTIALNALNAVLIDRKRADPAADPLQPLYEVMETGQSLIIFPEGTRMPQALPGPFKSGLFHLARRFPDVELIPVYLDNLHRSLPKGTLFPVPLICTVRCSAHRLRGSPTRTNPLFSNAPATPS